MFKYALYKVGQAILNFLPISLAYRFAALISDLQYYLSFRDRRAVKANLRKILSSPDQINSLARNVFRNFGRYLCEFFLMEKITDEEYLKNHVTIENEEVLKTIKNQNQGAIILSAHLGNWELGAALISRLGYPLMAIALPHKQRPVNDLFNKQRKVQGVEVVQTNYAVRRSLETLKAHNHIAVVGDRVFTGKGETLSFFGEPTLIPTGPAILSLKTGAPIVPTFMIRVKEDQFTLIFKEPIYPPKLLRENITDEIILEHIQKYKVVVEDVIREHPSQWLIFRRFWS